MKRIIHPLLFLTLILGACSTGVSSPEPFTASPTQPTISTEPVIPVSTNDTLPLPKLIATLSTPHIDQPPDGNEPTTHSTTEACGYMWASQNLTDLTLDLQTALKEMHPEAQGFAFAFGEDCVYQDGHKTFSAMETDFNITLPVNDLTDENGLGEWVVKVMDVIVDLPAEKIVGPRPGRVTIIFTSGTDQKFIQFYIDTYQALDPGMNGWEIYQALQAQQ